MNEISKEQEVEISQKMASNRAEMKRRWKDEISQATSRANELIACLERASSGLSESDLRSLLGPEMSISDFFFTMRERLPRLSDQLKMWAT